MKQIILKAAAFSFAIVMLFTALPDGGAVTANADKTANEDIHAVNSIDDHFLTETLTTPIISKKNVYSEKIELELENASIYDQETSFEIEVNGRSARIQSNASFKAAGCLLTTMDSYGYLKSSGEYTLRVRAVSGETASEWSEPVIAYTNSKTYYFAQESTSFGTLVDGRVVESGKLPQAVYAHAVITDVNGDLCEGEDTEAHSARYIMFTDGDYEGCLIPISQVSRVNNTEVLEKKPALPELELGIAFGDELSVKIANLETYDPETVFDVYVDDRFIKTVSYDELAKQGCILLENTASNYFAPGTKYRVTVDAQYRQLRSRTFKSFTTESVSYYKVAQGKEYYSYFDGNYFCAGLTARVGYGKGVYANSKGELIEGQTISSGKKDYVKITEGDYSGYYVKASDVDRATSKDIAENDKRKEEEAKRAAEAEKAAQAARLEAEAKARAQAEALAKAAENEAKGGGSGDSEGEISERDAKIAKVCNYAIANVGGRYVFAGNNFRATDCSGLTRLCYLQIGIELPHNAYQQAYRGTRVSLSNIQAGDLIITSGGGHVMIYIGNGEVVHASTYSVGIIRQSLTSAVSSRSIYAIVRII